MPRGRVSIPLIERFWKHVAIAGADDCWLWTAALFKNGYGRINESGADHAHRKVKLAHRVAWELTNGSIPDRMQVCHTCDVRYPTRDLTYRRCCNPSHAFLGTARDNIHDCIAKGRDWRGDKRGEKSNHAKLTDVLVREIRRHYADGEGSGQLARAYGLSPSTMHAVVTGKSWRHVPLDADLPIRTKARRSPVRTPALNNKRVRAIRDRYAAGDVTYNQLAAEFGVCRTTIMHLVKRMTWTHI